MRFALSLAAVLACAGWQGFAHAQTQTPAPATTASQPDGKIVGQDAMGDRSRSGPDGWSWAPVNRNQAPSGQAPAEAAGHGGPGVSAMPAPNVGRQTPPGQDPGTPMPTTPGGPGPAASPVVQR